MERLWVCCAISANRCGGTYSARTCSGRDCEISQFWHILQLTLQPAVATENARVPGAKWNSGFFSMGSTAMEQRRECTSE